MITWMLILNKLLDASVVVCLCVCVCVCVCVYSGGGLLHNSSLPITAPRSAVINSTPPFNYSTRLPRSRSQWERVIRPPAATAPSLLCHAVINLVAEPENGGEGWKRGRSCHREAERGDLQHPGDPVSGLLPLSAPRSHPQAQSQPSE